MLCYTTNILYDSDTELIPLKQELRVLQLLVNIKKFDTQTNLSAKISVYGDEEKKYISPLLIFSYLQTVLNDAEKDKNNMLDIILKIEDERLVCELYGYAEMVTEFNLFK